MPIFSRFGADFFTVYADYSRFVRDINGETKNISLSMSFFTVSFSRFAPSRNSFGGGGWERSIGTELGEGDATKQISVKNSTLH